MNNDIELLKDLRNFIKEYDDLYKKKTEISRNLDTNILDSLSYASPQSIIFIQSYCDLETKIKYVLNRIKDIKNKLEIQ